MSAPTFCRSFSVTPESPPPLRFFSKKRCSKASQRQGAEYPDKVDFLLTLGEGCGEDNSSLVMGEDDDESVVDQLMDNGGVAELWPESDPLR